MIFTDALCFSHRWALLYWCLPKGVNGLLIFRSDAARAQLLPCTDQKPVYRLVEGDNVHFVCEVMLSNKVQTLFEARLPNKEGFSLFFLGRLRGLVGSALDHRSLPPEFESRRGHIWRVVHLWLRFITFGGRSGHLAYRVHKNNRQTSIIVLIFLNRRKDWVILDQHSD